MLILDRRRQYGTHGSWFWRRNISDHEVMNRVSSFLPFCHTGASWIRLIDGLWWFFDTRNLVGDCFLGNNAFALFERSVVRDFLRAQYGAVIDSTTAALELSVVSVCEVTCLSTGDGNALAPS